MSTLRRTAPTGVRVAAVVLPALLLPMLSSPTGPDVESSPPSTGAVNDSVTDLSLDVSDIDLFVTDIDLEGSVVGLEREGGEEGTLTLESDVLFAFGSAELSPEAAAAVEQIGEDLPAEAGGEIRVTGHTDSIGSDADNLALSQARAKAVADVLTAAIGEGGPTIVAEGRGESEPVADNGTPENDNPEGRRLNRRVEIRAG
jgi:outer membrane protein OmpA-like peptidoglycan-associated protein